jgi:glutathione S-transferase
MLPLMLQLYTSRLGEGAAPLKPRIDSEIARHLGFVEAELTGRDWLVGDSLTGADIQMSFVGEIAKVYGLRAQYPAMDAWVGRFQARPAYARALEKGGTYAFV